MHSSFYTICSSELLKLASDDRMYASISKMAPEGVRVMLDPTKKKVKALWGGGVFGPSNLLEEAITPSKKLPTGKIIMTSKRDPVVLAHEMGHAQFDESLLGRALQNPYVRGVSTKAAPGAGTLAGLIVGARTGNPFAGAAVGAAVGALGHTPMLVGEGVASMKAVDNLRRAGATEPQIRQAKKEMGKWLLSYMRDPLTAATLGAIGGVVGGV